MKKRDNAADIKKKKDAEDKIKEEAAEKARKEAEEAALPEEERLLIENKKEAEALKAKGNELYKKKEFADALDYYQQAIDRCPKEITYYSNKAAVFFEMKNYDECIKYCDEAIETTKNG